MKTHSTMKTFLFALVAFAMAFSFQAESQKWRKRAKKHPQHQHGEMKHEAGHAHKAHSSKDRQSRVEEMKKELNLTKEQEDAFTKIHEAKAKNLDALRRKMEAEKTKMNDLKAKKKAAKEQLNASILAAAKTNPVNMTTVTANRTQWLNAKEAIKKQREVMAPLKAQIEAEKFNAFSGVLGIPSLSAEQRSILASKYVDRKSGKSRSYARPVQPTPTS